MRAKEKANPIMLSALSLSSIVTVVSIILLTQAQFRSTGFQFCGLLSLLNAMCVEKVAYGPFALYQFLDTLIFYRRSHLDIMLVSITIIRLATVGYILLKYLIKQKEYKLLVLLLAGSLFLGPFGAGWCSPYLFDLHPGRVLALAFLAFGTFVVTGTFFTGAPGLLTILIASQLLLRLHDLELMTADDIVAAKASGW